MTFRKFLFVLPAICLLSACQTTGTTQTANIPNGITPADANLTCAQMQMEFNRLDQIITAAGSAQTNSQMTSAGASAASQAAYSLGGYQNAGIINGLAGLAGNIGNINSQTQQQQAQAAQNRRSQLLTLAKEKGCM